MYSLSSRKCVQRGYIKVLLPDSYHYVSSTSASLYYRNNRYPGRKSSPFNNIYGKCSSNSSTRGLPLGDDLDG